MHEAKLNKRLLDYRHLHPTWSFFRVILFIAHAPLRNGISLIPPFP